MKKKACLNCRSLYDFAYHIMPIEIATEIRIFDQEQFHAMDKRVMAIVFAVHNEFGRLLDESIYKNIIATRCIQSGIEPAEREVRIRVKHQTFFKDYYVDLLLGHGLMLEAKTAEIITPANRAQSLNYLLLMGTKHGRLVNLRPDRVAYEFVSTSLDLAERRRFTVVDSDWFAPNPCCMAFKKAFIELLLDWGAFLEVGLYRDAMIHFFNGPTAATTDVEIWDGAHFLGRQHLDLLPEDIAFRCTALTQGIEQMGEHLQRLLAHTRLKFIQWVNLNHARIEFRTLSRKKT